MGDRFQKRQRGQTILEALIALAIVAGLGASIVLAFASENPASRGSQSRLVMETEASNAQVDAEAATAYDAAALHAVHQAAWSVTPAADPSALLTPSPVTFTATTERLSHDALAVRVSFADSRNAGSAAGAHTWTLQQLAPFPDTQVLNVPAGGS